MKTILTDIEGTTSSISFVKDVLFPYARRALPAFVAAHGDEPAVRQWLDVVATELGAACSDDVIVETLQGWIDQDRKHTALKALQGMVWKAGYGRADFRAHIYPDAAAALPACHTKPSVISRVTICQAAMDPAATPNTAVARPIRRYSRA